MINITNDSGSIRITDDVFTLLAGDAATSCFGVKGMAGRSKDGGPLQLLRRESMSKGGRRSAAAAAQGIDVQRCRRPLQRR